MRDGDDGPGIVVEEPLQPGHGLGIEVVGRLVQEQHVGLVEQQPAQGDAAPFAAGYGGDRHLAWRTAQRIHGDGDPAIDIPGIRRIDALLEIALFGEQRRHLLVVKRLGEARAHRLEPCHQGVGLGHPFGHAFEHRLGVVEHRLLREISHLEPIGRPRLAGELRLEPGHNAQQRRLARPVEAENPNLRAGQKGERDVLEHLAAAGISHAQTLGYIDVLGVCHGAGRNRVRHAVEPGASSGKKSSRDNAPTLPRSVNPFRR